MGKEVCFSSFVSGSYMLIFGLTKIEQSSETDSSIKILFL